MFFCYFSTFHFSGIEHEESLLHESAMRESSLNTLNVNMEVELKQAKAEVHRLRTEKQSLEQEYNDLNKTKDVTTVEVRLRCYLQGRRNVLRGLRPKIFGDVGSSSYHFLNYVYHISLSPPRIIFLAGILSVEQTAVEFFII